MKEPNNISLRAMEPEDLDLLYKIENDMKMWNISTTNVPYSRYMLHDYIAGSTGDIFTDRQVRLIIEKDKKTAVGLVDLVDFDPRNRRAEVGIVILKEYQNEGFATEALAQIEHYSTEVVHLHQLYAFIDMDNNSSIRLFMKAGYERGGELQQWTFDGKKYHHALIMQRFLEKSQGIIC